MSKNKIIPIEILKQKMQEAAFDKQAQSELDLYNDVTAELRAKREIIDREMDLIDRKMNKIKQMEDRCGQLLDLREQMRKSRLN